MANFTSVISRDYCMLRTQRHQLLLLYYQLPELQGLIDIQKFRKDSRLWGGGSNAIHRLNKKIKKEVGGRLEKESRKALTDVSSSTYRSSRRVASSLIMRCPFLIIPSKSKVPRSFKTNSTDTVVYLLTYHYHLTMNGKDTVILNKG